MRQESLNLCDIFKTDLKCNSKLKITVLKGSLLTEHPCSLYVLGS